VPRRAAYIGTAGFTKGGIDETSKLAFTTMFLLFAGATAEARDFNRLLRGGASVTELESGATRA
jgi:hypothetical protein